MLYTVDYNASFMQHKVYVTFHFGAGVGAGVGADAWFNLGPAGTAGACFILVGPVWPVHGLY